MNVTRKGRRFGALVFAVASTVGLVLAIGVGSSGAENSSVAKDPGGTPCVDAINGRGATFAKNAQDLLATKFSSDPNSPCDGSPTLVEYNYPASAGFTGSGNGQKAASCRTDAFGGSDIPYNLATLVQLNGPPGTTGGCTIGFTPPNPPNVPPYPDAADVQANVMTIPYAAGAVGVGSNVPKSSCGGTKVPTLELTGKMVSLLAGGEIQNWNDARLRAAGLNPKLANCNLAVTRVVRMDRSGTTQIYKNYLQRVDPDRTGAVCAPGSGWTFYAQDAQNQNWPEGAGCSALTRPGTSGNEAVVTLCKATTGAVCYAEIADMAIQKLAAAEVRAGAGTKFVPPLKKNKTTRKKTESNCSTANASLPGTTPSDAVGLDPNDTWATDNPSGNHGDITNVGNKYPICGLTFALVYTGLNDNPPTPNAIDRLSQAQRQTLYDYYTYVLSASGQKWLGTRYYAPISPSWLNKLKTGYQDNF